MNWGHLPTARGQGRGLLPAAQGQVVGGGRVSPSAGPQEASACHLEGSAQPSLGARAAPGARAPGAAGRAGDGAGAALGAYGRGQQGPGSLWHSERGEQPGWTGTGAGGGGQAVAGGRGRGGAPLVPHLCCGRTAPGRLHSRHVALALFWTLLEWLQPKASASSGPPPPPCPRSAPRAWLRACPLLQETLSP